MKYSIYHIPDIKIGCTLKKPEDRVKEQGYKDFEILETHLDVMEASWRELKLQKEYKYKVDSIPYFVSLQRITKASKISADTKNEWLPKVDWKAREEKIDKEDKWNKIKSSANYINMDRKGISLKSQAKFIKPLLQYDLEGNFIKRWNISNRAMKQTQYPNASGAANPNSKSKTMYGYIWKYEK
tara:strand:+ start:42 stop:593 length:552 start_codon:yes stop_codon:yes gene_type:complete